MQVAGIYFMSAVKIILQARLNSSRLPGKMLLPIGGMPLVVLCAKRAMTSGYSIVVATSLENSDDPLAESLAEHGIPHVRGSLDDVLARFLKATADMNDDDLIVRLTGDNPFVDGDFVKEIVAFHQREGTDYTRSFSPFDRLPYGVSAEVMRVGKLRELNQMDLTPYDREHVTIYPTKNNDYALFISPLDKDFSHLRATIDTPDDYERVADIFDNLDEDPLTVSWQVLVQKLQNLPDAPKFRIPYKKVGLKAESRLALGTVQLGLNYGVANKSGQPGVKEAKNILETAIAHGVNLIDTAAAYGDSEQVIGVSLDTFKKQEISIHTKLAPTVTKDTAQDSVQQSCERLGLKSLPCLMLHRWEHYRQDDGQIWQTLLDLKEEGLIKKLGTSVQSPDEALEALQEHQIEFIQLPFNICDWRWRESGFIEVRQKRHDIHIQTRSALLQGVFLLSPDQWPVLDTAEAQTVAKTLQTLVQDYKRASVQDLCYAYSRSQNWIDSIVVGVETLDQLKENLALFNAPELDNIEDVEKRIPRVDINFLDPAKWN